MIRKTTLLLAACLTAPVFAEDAWIKRNAELRADASAAGDSIARVERGDRVNVLEKSGPWVRVDFRGKVGWVSGESLSSREVKPEVKLAGPLGTDARASSGAAAKGLQPITSDYARRNGLSTRGVDEMEDIKKSITPQMLKEFAAEGQIEPPRRRGRRGSGAAAPAPADTNPPAAQPRPSVPDQY